ncbi:MAG: hypothetical protein ACRD29_19020 [Acidimicrobiales bacterium]
MTDEPELDMVKFPDLLGDEWRAECDGQRRESRRRYRDLLAGELDALDPAGDPTERALAILEILFTRTRREGGECRCSCHPRLPDGDLHDYGFACPCQQTAEERKAAWADWFAARDAFWDSDEGRRLHAAAKRRQPSWRSGWPTGRVVPRLWLGAVGGSLAGKEMQSVTLGYMRDEPTVQRSFRLSRSTVDLLDAAASAGGLSRNALADLLLGEALRLQHHPLIGFQPGAAGRRQPLVVGTRLYVHQVISTLRASGGNVGETAAYLGLPPLKVRAALNYYADFGDEVDADAAAAEQVEVAERARWERQQRAIG